MVRYASKECAACGVVKPANEMIQTNKKVLRSTSGWGINFGILSGGRTNRNLTWLRAPRDNFVHAKVWHCEACWQQIDDGERAASKSRLFRGLIIGVIIVIGLLIAAIKNQG